jgi:hypothetical protein
MIGRIALGVFLLLFGLTALGLHIPAVIVGIVALIAGILTLIGK